MIFAFSIIDIAFKQTLKHVMENLLQRVNKVRSSTGEEHVLLYTNTALSRVLNLSVVLNIAMDEGSLDIELSSFG